MDFLKNLSVNLRATGPAAVMCVWVICVTVLGTLGSGPMAERAMSLLAFFGGGVLVALAWRS